MVTYFKESKVFTNDVNKVANIEHASVYRPFGRNIGGHVQCWKQLAWCSPIHPIDEVENCELANLITLEADWLMLLSRLERAGRKVYISWLS